MTKICGLISDDPSIHVPTLLDRMYEASWQPCYRRREVWSNDSAGFGHFNIGAVNTEPQPIIDAVSEAVAAFCGKIFDYGTERRSLQEEGIAFQWPDNDGEFLLHWVRRNGAQELKSTNGIFSLAVWDSTRSRLLLTGDRYGFRPLYYYHDVPRGALVFASDLRGILATGLPPLGVNWAAVNTFLHLGHVLGEETLFEGIYRLPPAGVLTFENNEVRLDRYWRLVDLPVREDMTRDEAVDECVALFQQAIRRRLQASTAKHIVTLSGGQDSRHIVAELKKQGVDFTAYTTTGFKPTLQDKALAEQVARKLDIVHEYVPLPKKDFLTLYWPRAHALMDYEADLHEWILPLLDNLPGGPHISFDGILGDVCLSDVYLNTRDYRMAREGRLDELARELVEREHWPPVFHPSIMRRLNDRIFYESVRAQFYAFCGHPNLISFTYMAMRTTRAISLFAFKLVSEKAESFFPFADNDYFDFAMSIPPEHKLDGKMHRRVLDRAYPELHGVPTTKEVDRRNYYSDEINYLGQKRQYLRQGLWKMIQGRPWVFNRQTALPRLLRDLALASINRDGRFFLCNPANVLLAEWFERYFPDGVDETASPCH